MLLHFPSAGTIGFPKIIRSWMTYWNNLNTLLNYLQSIRKALYTTNTIELHNRIIRKEIKKRKLLPTDDSARKMVCLEIEDASKNGRCSSETERRI